MDRNESSDGMNMDDLPFLQTDSEDKTQYSGAISGRESPSGSFSPEYSFTRTEFFSEQTVDGTVVSQSSSLIVSTNSAADGNVEGDSFLDELRRISGRSATDRSSGIFFVTCIGC